MVVLQTIAALFNTTGTLQLTFTILSLFMSNKVGTDLGIP